MRKVIISGGGTGGHIFPAVAIANEIKSRYPDCEILFIGAKGRMEMQKVPQAGYQIEGLDIAGLQRKLDPKNLLLPFKVIKSLLQARSIIKRFKPEVAVGVGGYASAPMLFMAQMAGIPTLIQEQNSFAGLTNRILAKRAKKICVAYPNMDQVFQAEKIVLTGNPVRKDIASGQASREEALKFFGLESDKPVLLAIGGSLGARTINTALKEGAEQVSKAGIQLLWQCGKSAYPNLKDINQGGIQVHEFIQRMDLAYAAADVVISRAGALSVSELCLVAKPSILVPSPHVAEDHQTKNAKVLADAGAAILVKDSEAGQILVDEAISLTKRADLKTKLSNAVRGLAYPEADKKIVDCLEGLL
ncbi:MAG: undecaprenyldiphospho-muramoylpentapeptide beta-N-acetylglucosaminyltransferase [Bacteroidetes bacterium]|nr:MAG: undecaprenyldiphospho-muramoylpentapeptide beta-N-acetylglucosaminyltransferase [Bacteroidota bacterium]